jgi:hypothetical protein
MKPHSHDLWTDEEGNAKKRSKNDSSVAVHIFISGPVAVTRLARLSKPILRLFCHVPTSIGELDKPFYDFVDESINTAVFPIISSASYVPERALWRVFLRR